MTHTHHKWPCPKSDGRHQWMPDLNKSHLWDQRNGKMGIGIPVICYYDCGAYGTEWYKFDELIEGE